MTFAATTHDACSLLAASGALSPLLNREFEPEIRCRPGPRAAVRRGRSGLSTTVFFPSRRDFFLAAAATRALLTRSDARPHSRHIKGGALNLLRSRGVIRVARPPLALGLPRTMLRRPLRAQS